MPEHVSHEPAVELPPTRRNFYILFINGAMGLIGAALAVPAAIYLLFPPKARKAAEWVKTADLSSIPTGKPTEISFQRTRADGWQVITEKTTAWVVKQSDNQVIAFTPNCTHLGCALSLGRSVQHFRLPVPYLRLFDRRQSARRTGPAPARSLRSEGRERRSRDRTPGTTCVRSSTG